MKFIQKEHFYDSLSQKLIILPYYDRLTNALNNECLLERTEKGSLIKKTISISLCPSFLEYSFFKKDELILKKVDQKKIIGYAILIKERKNLDLFLKQEYKKSFNNNIKRFVNRFEACFNVKYEIHYGSIEKEVYNTLMASLKNMLIKRFDQRRDSTHALKNWNYYFESIYAFILEKKASILAIYANEKLIHVCVNHHFKNILFVSIPSYDINYSKFSLGNISIHKLLEWCLENEYYMLDMAYGDLEYKKRWSNYMYSFQHHILAPKGKPIFNLIGDLEVLIIKAKNILKKYHIDALVKKLKNLKLKENNYTNHIEYTIETSPEVDLKYLTEIDHFNINNDHLQKMICDFLFKHKVHIEQIKVFEIETSKSYLICGKNITEKINFLNKL